ncbi:MAG: ubiquinol-cytochrome c reductase cytochrome b subunit [Acidimicrobiales bacterium]|nr:ubiquinol-cytochrome c reductase cytochrome b subunit [Acidimicrobiales bacterium]
MKAPSPRVGIEAVAGRLGAGRALSSVTHKVFPTHRSFLWGELALYSFVVLLVTGVYLTFFFEASQEVTTYTGSYEPLNGREVSLAYDSVMRTQFDTRAGALIRQTHHWAAITFVAAIVLHLARIYFTGAFRKPREINWLVGSGLLVLALGAGFTGYSLPDDLLSGTGLRIANGIILSIPVIGEWLADMIFGGEWPGAGIIGRLYPVHIMLIPALIIGLLSVHLAIVWRQKHTQFPGEGRTEHNVVGQRVWPGFAMKSIGLLFLTAAVITAMGAVFTVNAVWLYGPYEPAAATSFAQPDWYIGFLEGTVRLFPNWEPHIGGHMLPNPFYAAVLLPGIIFTTLFMVPFIERRVTGDRAEHHLLDRPRDAPVRTSLGVAALSLMALLFVGGAQDIVAETSGIPVGRVTTILQISLLVVPAISGWTTWRICKALTGVPESSPQR